MVWNGYLKLLKDIEEMREVSEEEVEWVGGV